MNLGAPRARVLIGPQAPCRWRSNGHLRRCRCASGPHVHTEYAPVRSQAASHAVQILHGPTLSALVRLASGAFLNRLKPLADQVNREGL
jgi:hypothetical protein